MKAIHCLYYTITLDESVSINVKLNYTTTMIYMNLHTHACGQFCNLVKSHDFIVSGDLVCKYCINLVLCTP